MTINLWNLLPLFVQKLSSQGVEEMHLAEPLPEAAGEHSFFEELRVV